MITAPQRTISIDLPKKLGFLLELHPYKVAYGGRFGLKSWSFAQALLALAAAQRLRILCVREYQNSIDESVHQLLCSQIEKLGLTGFFRYDKTSIVGGNGSSFSYEGLAEHTADSIKSFEGADILWAEEAHKIAKRSWDIVIPTIRAANSEIWVSFNPDMDNDDTYQRWVVNPPPGTKVVKMGWQDAQAYGWFPEKENEKRLHFKRTQPADYDNIWEGIPRSIVAGAIYAKEIGEMIRDSRIRAVPYDPRLPVHTVWDLGWNDKMVVIMFQKPLPGIVNVINYYEDNFRRYDEVVAVLDTLGYRWGTDWLPHDGENHNPQTGKSPKKTLEELGRKRVKIIGGGKRPDPDRGIEAARMMFPRVYIDNSTREHPPASSAPSG
jgi:phage terminase large subunit